MASGPESLFLLRECVAPGSVDLRKSPEKAAWKSWVIDLQCESSSRRRTAIKAHGAQGSRSVVPIESQDEIRVSGIPASRDITPNVFRASDTGSPLPTQFHVTRAL